MFKIHGLGLRFEGFGFWVFGMGFGLTGREVH